MDKQSNGGWKAAAKKNWLAIGVPEFLAGIGIDFDKYFIEAGFFMYLLKVFYTNNLTGFSNKSFKV